jgi:hypothetical protein
MATATDDRNAQFFAGMEVQDYEGHKIGKIVRYDDALGYLETQGPFSGPRYIPYYAVESIGAEEIHLNVTKDTVSDVYKRMPAVKPEVTASGKLTGGGTVESGWDPNKRVPLDAEALALLRERIRTGTTVYDETDQKLGNVDAYDPKTGYMRIKKGALVQKDIFLPATSVAYLDDKGIHLTMTKEAIANRFASLPEIAKQFFA